MATPTFSALLPDVTLQQIEELQALLGSNKTQIVIQAVAMMYRNQKEWEARLDAKAAAGTNLQDLVILATAIYLELYGKGRPGVFRTEMTTRIENWLVESESDHDQPDVKLLAQQFQQAQGMAQNG